MKEINTYKMAVLLYLYDAYRAGYL